MHWLNDHLISLAAGVLGVIVIVTLVLMVVRGLRLWRAFKGSKRRVDPSLTALQEGTARVERGIAHLNAAADEERERIAELQRSLTQLQLLAAQFGRAVGILRAPLRYIGR